jgi:hypothetical protein
MSYEIHAIHSEGAESVIETGKRFISAFEGESGVVSHFEISKNTAMQFS